MYLIEVTSSFEELYRYNTMVMCGGYDSSQKELYVTSQRDDATAGEEFILPQVVRLKADKAESIRVLVYLLPHTLPQSREVEESIPFAVSVRIEREGQEVYNQTHFVNQWGGAAIEIKL